MAEDDRRPGGARLRRPGVPPRRGHRVVERWNLDRADRGSVPVRSGWSRPRSPGCAGTPAPTAPAPVRSPAADRPWPLARTGAAVGGAVDPFGRAGGESPGQEPAGADAVGGDTVVGHTAGGDVAVASPEPAASPELGPPARMLPAAAESDCGAPDARRAPRDDQRARDRDGPDRRGPPTAACRHRPLSPPRARGGGTAPGPRRRASVPTATDAEADRLTRRDGVAAIAPPPVSAAPAGTPAICIGTNDAAQRRIRGLGRQRRVQLAGAQHVVVRAVAVVVDAVHDKHRGALRRGCRRRSGRARSCGCTCTNRRSGSCRRAGRPSGWCRPRSSATFRCRRRAARRRRRSATGCRCAAGRPRPWGTGRARRRGCAARGRAPSSRPLTCILTSAVVPLTVIHATPLPVTLIHRDRVRVSPRRTPVPPRGPFRARRPRAPDRAHRRRRPPHINACACAFPSGPTDMTGCGSAPTRPPVGSDGAISSHPGAPVHEHRVMGVKNGQPRRAISATGSTGKYNGEHTGEDAAEPAQRRGPPGRAAGRAASGATPPVADGPPHQAGHDRAADRAAAQSGLDADGLGSWVPRHRTPPPDSPPPFSSPRADEPLAARTRAVEPAGRVDARHRDRASFRLGGAARHRRTRPLGRRWLLVGALAVLVGVVLAGSALAARSGTDDQPAMPGRPASTVDLRRPGTSSDGQRRGIRAIGVVRRPARSSALRGVRHADGRGIRGHAGAGRCATACPPCPARRDQDARPGDRRGRKCARLVGRRVRVGTRPRGLARRPSKPVRCVQFRSCVRPAGGSGRTRSERRPAQGRR